MTRNLSGSQLHMLRTRLARLDEPRFRAVLAERCGAAALKLVADEFRGEHAPDGTPWKPISRNGKILRKTGRLYRSFSAAPSRDGFRIGTAVGYAGYQHFGTHPRMVAARIARQNARGRFVSGRARAANRKNFVGTETRGAFLVRIGEHENPGITARPMLPGRDLPPNWTEAFEREVGRATRELITSGSVGR